MSAFRDIAKDAVERGHADARIIAELGAELGNRLDGVAADEAVTVLFDIDRACEEQNDGAWKAFFQSAMASIVKEAASEDGPKGAVQLDLLKRELNHEHPPRFGCLDLLVHLGEAAGQASPAFTGFLHDVFLEVHSHHRDLTGEDVERIDRAIGWTRNKDIDRVDANFLFALNDILNKEKTNDAWQRLFVEAISQHVLFDPNSPGQVDFSEAEWLIRSIEGDGSLDKIERALLDHLDSVSPKGQNLGDLVASVSELMKAQEDNYLKTIRALVRALEAKDRYTAQHSSRVSYFSHKLGKRIGLSEKMQRKLRYGSIMHDLGKIGVPDEILNKPSRLTDEEYKRIRRHPIDTAKIMMPLEDLKEFKDIAMLHHERWDGGGYPDGLEKTAIPLLSRIVAIADTWDAMVGDRVYRDAISRDKALEILERERDMGQWDPELLDVFIEMIREGLDAEQDDEAEIEG